VEAHFVTAQGCRFVTGRESIPTDIRGAFAHGLFVDALAGAAGLDIKGTELLGHADSEDEALEIITALTQMYREQGHYLERIYKWAKRVGMDTIKGAIIDDLAKRRHYAERFAYSQQFAQVDPWEERVNGKDAHEFAAMAEFGLPQAAE